MNESCWGQLYVKIGQKAECCWEGSTVLFDGFLAVGVGRLLLNSTG